MITVRNLSKKFQDKLVLEDIDFEVNDAEIVGLVGPNGAGKTTLLNIIAGIIPPTNGEIKIDGHALEKDLAKIHQILGYIPDTPFLYPKLTGREFLDFVSGLYRLSKKDLESKIQELSKALELDFWIEELMEGYPRGVRQKITLAGMLLHSPRILLLDEPTANLDPKSSRLVKELLQRMAKKGASILISTHILEIAERLCQRIIILDKGKILVQGTIEALREIAKIPQYNLEEIFLHITAGKDYAELLNYLS